jgi:hypothetical protein
MSWSYECPSGGLEDEFLVAINEPTNDSNADVGVQEMGSAGSGEEYYYDTGQFNLAIVSDCTWSITVAPSFAGALTAPVTYTNAQTGLSGNPQEFTVGGKWTMAWSYECPTVGDGGIFAIEINEPSGDQSTDIGPFQAGTSGSGTNTYNDIGAQSRSRHGPTRVLARRIRRWDLLVRLRPIPRFDRRDDTATSRRRHHSDRR